MGWAESPDLGLSVRCNQLSHFLPAGKEYAINQLTLFLAIVATDCDWERKRTPDSGEGSSL